jgi:hypothetical protein
MTEQYDGGDRPGWLDQVLGFFSPPFVAKYGGSATACKSPAAWSHPRSAAEPGAPARSPSGRQAL